MFEQQYVLNKIEQWAERLPYKTLWIEVELPGQTLTLKKSKVRPIGFSALKENEVREHGHAELEK